MARVSDYIIRSVENADKLDGYDADDFAFMIKEDTTLAVPANYSSIAEALNYMKDKAIKEGVTVTISVASGTYSMPKVEFFHPYGSQIVIAGNSAARPTLACTTTGFYVSRSCGLQLKNLILTGTTGPGNAVGDPYEGYYAAIHVEGGAYVKAENIDCSGFAYGYRVDLGGSFHGIDTSFTGSGSTIGLFVQFAGNVYLEDSAFSGGYDGVVVSNGGVVYLNNTTIQNMTHHGITTSGGGTIYTRLCTITVNDIGALSTNNASLNIDRCTIQSNRHGLVSWANGSSRVSSSTLTGNTDTDALATVSGTVMLWQGFQGSTPNTVTTGFPVITSQLRATTGNMVVEEPTGGKIIAFFGVGTINS